MEQERIAKEKIAEEEVYKAIQGDIFILPPVHVHRGINFRYHLQLMTYTVNFFPEMRAEKAAEEAMKKMKKGKEKEKDEKLMEEMAKLKEMHEEDVSKTAETEGENCILLIYPNIPLQKSGIKNSWIKFCFKQSMKTWIRGLMLELKA